MAGIRHLAVVDGDHEIPICLCSDAADQVVHGGDTVRGQEADSANGLQVSDDLFKSAIQFSNGLVNLGFYRQEFGGFRVRAAALKLRQRTVRLALLVAILPPIRRFGQGAFGADNTGRCPLGFGFTFRFARFVWLSRPRLCFLFLSEF
jgi:hypothetical protein